MIRIEPQPWAAMVAHACLAYPDECCGALLGSRDGGHKVVREALPLHNAFDGAQSTRYLLRPEDLLAAGDDARGRGMDLIGIYHSHPDCGACFSEADLKNSWPWYSFVVLAIYNGEFHHAHSWLPNSEQTEAAREELMYE
jgi:proteasome lid subunit RPN8/RPN11